ncbi:hypothetical protein MMC34_006396 [Xylographa carneopallida]|nr:hypothetical protein [Xylographa carneopallida]
MFRHKFLSKVFESIAASDSSASRLKSLSINYLQEVNDPVLTTSSTFLAIIKNLEVLKLSIMRIPNHFDDGVEIYDLESFVFLEQLPSVWLRPAAHRLTTLSLYRPGYWGWWPKADFRDVYLSSLRVLALGNFTFAHEIHIQWLLKHGGTLEELYLNDCRLVCSSEAPGPMDSLGSPTKEGITSANAFIEICGYSSRWFNHFARFKRSLSKSRVFQMGIFDMGHAVRDAKGLLDYAEKFDCQRRHLCRYVAFDTTTVPNWWEDEDIGLYEADLEEHDHEAMAELWSTVDERAERRSPRPEWRVCSDGCAQCSAGDYYPAH